MKKVAAKKVAGDEVPRYVQIANQLRAQISDGTYPVGAQLPTEHELCEMLGASRFTVREAIRVLSTAGLVHRKPRAGTLVAALPDDTRYTQGISSLRDLFQYAHSTDFQYVYVGRIGLSREQARRMGAAAGDEWIYAVALRRDKPGGPPFCITRLFLNPLLDGIEKELRKTHGPVYALIEGRFGHRIDRVEQAIVGVVIDAQDGANLEVPPGTPGLSITRSYYDAKGRLLELADNVHPAARFTYRMVLQR